MSLKSSGKKKMRKQVIILTSALSRWCQVKADLMFAFEQSLNADLTENLKQSIRDMLSRVRGGMPLEKALNRLSDFSDQEQFLDLISAVKVNARHRGDLPALMEMLELQFFRLEEAYQQRRISSRSDLRSTILCFVVGLIVFAGRFISSTVVRASFLETEIGIVLLAASIGCYFLGLISLVATIRRIND